MQGPEIEATIPPLSISHTQQGQATDHQQPTLIHSSATGEGEKINIEQENIHHSQNRDVTMTMEAPKVAESIHLRPPHPSTIITQHPKNAEGDEEAKPEENPPEGPPMNPILGDQTIAPSTIWEVNSPEGSKGTATRQMPQAQTAEAHLPGPLNPEQAARNYTTTVTEVALAVSPDDPPRLEAQLAQDPPSLLEHDEREFLTQILAAPSMAPPRNQSAPRELPARRRETQMPEPFRVIAHCLADQVQFTDLALVYGLDLDVLTKTIQNTEHAPTANSAATELQTLKGIQKYLMTNRPKIRYSGESSIAPLIRIPTRLLSIEKDRLEALERRGKRRARNYTDHRKPEMFRCPISGCAGSAVNIACIKTAMNSHCNTFHKDPPVVYTFHVEFTKNWDIFTYPARHPAPEVVLFASQTSHPGESHDSQPRAAQEPGERDDDCQQEARVPKAHTDKPSVSALRLSLRGGLPPASSTNQLEFCTHEAEQVWGTGVYAFPTTSDGAAYAQTPLEIGTRNTTREAWARELGAGPVLTEIAALEHPQTHGCDEADDSELDPPLESQQDPTANALLTPATHTDPTEFQMAILALQPLPPNDESEVVPVRLPTHEPTE